MGMKLYPARNYSIGILEMGQNKGFFDNNIPYYY